MIILQKFLFLIIISILYADQLNTSFLLCLLVALIFFSLQLLVKNKKYQYGLLGVYIIFILLQPCRVIGLPLLYAPAYFPLSFFPAILPFVFRDYISGLLYLLGLLFSYLDEENKRLDERYRQVRDDYEEKTLRLNASLYQSNERRITENKMLIMEERNRISSKLHDTIGHTITSSLLQLEAIKLSNRDESIEAALNTVSDSLSEGMDEIRSVLHNLKGEAILLDKEMEKLFEKTNLEYALDLSQEEISMERKFTILTLVKEAITNTLKHSDATKMRVQLTSHPAFDALKITDNGSRKVDVQKLHYGMGLIGMYDIVENNKGIIRFNYDEGFEIYITLMKEER